MKHCLDIPDDILLHIFQFLTPSFVCRTASLVSTSWNCVSSSCQLWRFFLNRYYEVSLEEVDYHRRNGKKIKECFAAFARWSNGDNVIRYHENLNGNIGRRVKIVFFGCFGSGKTSLINRFTMNIFHEDQSPRLQPCFITKDHTVNGTSIQYELWETEGCEIRGLAAPYFQGVAGAVLCFDLSNRDSFERIKCLVKGFKVLKNQFTGHPILVGCKGDLKHHHQITLQEAKEFAFLNGMVYFETSSKTGECVDEAMTFLGKQILEKQGFVKPKHSLKHLEDVPERKSWCVIS